MKKELFLYFLLICFTSIIYGQNASYLEFDKTTHDFGTVKEELGVVSHTFNFVNKSEKPISIKNVIAGCGCTASDFSKEEILPGQKGFVKISYTTSKRPGIISQKITIITDYAGKPHIDLFITGEVTPRIPKTIDNYPIAIGNLNFKTTHLSFGDIKNTETHTLSLEIYNNLHKSMSLKLVKPPDFITYEFIPKKLKPEEEGLLKITYDAKKKNNFGLIYSPLTIKTNDKEKKQKGFYVSANIKEDFSNLSLNDLKYASNIEFETLHFNFDTLPDNELIKYRFAFKNTGHSALIIRKIATSCACTASKTYSDTVEAGENAWIEIEFNPSGRKGYQRQTIHVITNSPHSSETQLIIQGYIH